MLTCPICQQSVKSDALTCPHCRTELKAHGHRGIPLHRATGVESLCQSCLYHTDDSCNYPKRPDARECTMYVPARRVATIGAAPFPNRPSSLDAWVRRHGVWLGLIGLIVLSLLMALSRR